MFLLFCGVECAALKEVEVQGTFTVTVNDAQRASLPCLQVGAEAFNCETL